MTQLACDRCTQGVLDADQPEIGYYGNDHLHNRCQCDCHKQEGGEQQQ